MYLISTSKMKKLINELEINKRFVICGSGETYTSTCLPFPLDIQHFCLFLEKNKWNFLRNQNVKFSVIIS